MSRPSWSHVAGMAVGATAWVVTTTIHPPHPAVTITASIVGMVLTFAAGWMVGRVSRRGRGGAS